MNLALLIVALILVSWLLSKCCTPADETVTPTSISPKNLRHHLRAECAAGVDLPSWPVQPKGARPYWDRKPARLHVVRQERAR